MKSKRVWLLVGIPGSGKSTWVQKQIAENHGVWCSRDKVRFSLVREDEPYFKCEHAVFNAWVQEIKDALNNPLTTDIYVDATHLNDRSRDKVLRQLPKENIGEVVNVVFVVPIEICLERNKMRPGREAVPEEVIKNMANNLELPKKYRTIFIDKDGNECVLGGK